MFLFNNDILEHWFRFRIQENNLHRVFSRDGLHNYMYDLKIMILCSSCVVNDLD
jgi:hypothetical protein